MSNLVKRKSGSATRESRAALGHEGGDALLIIGAATKFAHQVAFDYQLILKRLERGGANGVLGRGEPACRPLRETRGERPGLGLQRLVVDAFPDPAPGFG